jgi:hypothetical protein
MFYQKNMFIFAYQRMNSAIVATRVDQSRHDLVVNG